MPSIADVYVTLLPETSKVAEGIRKAVREADSGLPKLHVDADTTKAEEQIEKTVQKPRKPKITPEADTKKAEEELDKTARDRDTKIKVNVDRGQLDQLNRLIGSGSLDQAGSLSRLMSARMEFEKLRQSPQTDSFDMSKSLLSLRSAEQSFANSMQQDVGQAINTGGSAGLSALTPALMGVGITMAAGIASSLSGLAGLLPAGLLGAGAVIGTLATGLDGVKDAWDSAGKAADSSGTDQAAKAKDVAAAQRTLQDAVQGEKQAQQDVANARKDALTQLRDLNLELRGGALNEKQAQLDALKARQDLATGQFKTALDYQQAQLRVEEADQRVAESHQRNIDLQTKANDERAKGVDNADGVVRANQNLARSQQQVATAQDNLNTVTNQVSSAATKAAEDMAKLSPNAQAFVNTMLGMKPAFEALKFSVQDSLFAGLGPQIQQLATQYLPLLQGAMSGMAGTMNQAFGQIAQLFAKPETMATMQRIFSSIGGSFQIWSQAITPFTQAFLRFTEVGAGFLPQLAQMAVDAANAFNGFAQSGQLQQWMQTAMTALGEVGKMLPTLGQMFMDLAPLGLPVLNALNTALTALAPAIGPIADLFGAMVREMTPGLGLMIQTAATIVGGLAPAFTQFFNAMAPVAQQLAGALQPVLMSLAPVLSQVAGQLGSALAGAVQQLAPLLVPLVQQFGQFLIAMLPLLPSLMQLATTALPMITSALVPLLPKFAEILKKMTDGALVIVPQIVSAMSTFSDKVTSAFNTVKSVWDVTLGPIFETMSRFAGPLNALANIAGSGGDGHIGTVIPKTGAAPSSTTGTLSTRGAPTAIPGVGSAPGATPGVLSTKGTAGDPVYTAPSAPTFAGPSGYTGDQALLAAVPAGRYSQTGNADLTKGLGDCSSAIEDLVNIMQGRPTGGRSMSTGNEAQWLTEHGFQPGMGGPGDFRVGFNNHHTQATLPGGTPFNWGSDSAAAKRGIGGSGASDPAFTSHYYLPVGAGGAMPQMPGVTPGPTGAANDPYFMQYPDGYKPPGPDMGQLGQQMGGDIWSSILPDGFKNPTQFGGMKFLTGLMGGLLGMPMGGNSTGAGKGMPASYWANGGGGGGGGIGGMLSGLAGITSQPFGNLQIGSPGSAPGSFMPGMPTPADASASPFGIVGQPGTAGPGNNGQVVDNSINVVNPMGQDHFNNMVTTATQAQVPRARQGMRPLP